MEISENKLAEFLYNESMKESNKTITRQDADWMAEVMVSAAMTAERVLTDARRDW